MRRNSNRPNRRLHKNSWKQKRLENGERVGVAPVEQCWEGGLHFFLFFKTLIKTGGTMVKIRFLANLSRESREERGQGCKRNRFFTNGPAAPDP